MEVYVEDLLFSNSIINFILLKQIKSFFSIKNSNIMTFIASFIGSVFSLFYPLLHLNSLGMLILKICVVFLIVNIAFAKEKRKNIILLIVSFLVYSFTFSGFADFFGIHNINAIWLVIPFSFMNYIVTIVKEILKRKLINSNYLYDTEFILNGKKIKSLSFMDSGNSIKYNGNSLMVVNLAFLLKFYPEYIKDSKLKFPFKIVDYVEFESVNTKGKMYITKFDKIVIYNKKEKHIFSNVEVGININNFKNYDMLFSLENLD